MTKCDHREYGFAKVQVNKFGNGQVDALFRDLGDEMDVRPRYTTVCASLDSITLISLRFGCRMEISFPGPLQTSMLLAIPTPLPMPPLPTTASLSTESNSTPKLPTPSGERRLSDDSFSISASAHLIGLWSVSSLFCL